MLIGIVSIKEVAWAALVSKKRFNIITATSPPPAPKSPFAHPDNAPQRAKLRKFIYITEGSMRKERGDYSMHNAQCTMHNYALIWL